MPKLPSLLRKFSRLLKEKDSYWIESKEVTTFTITQKRRVVVPLHKRDLPKGTFARNFEASRYN